MRHERQQEAQLPDAPIGHRDFHDRSAGPALLREYAIEGGKTGADAFSGSARRQAVAFPDAALAEQFVQGVDSHAGYCIYIQHSWQAGTDEYPVKNYLKSILEKFYFFNSGICWRYLILIPEKS
jgi:hypothetical protein